MLKIYALFGDDAPLPFKLDSGAAQRRIQRVLPQVQRYRQFKRTPEQFESMRPAPYGASAEFWLTPDASDALPEAAKTIHHAGDKLSDVFTLDPMLVEHGVEHNIMGDPSIDSGYKCTFLFNRKRSMSLVDFHAHWLQNHGPIAAKTQDAQRYVQSHLNANDRRYDGITELFWADYPTALASMASEQMRTDQANDAKNFVDGDSLVMFLAAEYG